eukprot:g6068.t1
MKEGRFHPLLQVGAEGCLELVLLAALVVPIVQTLPGPDAGHLEDVLGAAGEVARVPLLAAFCGAAFLGLASLNPLSMAIGGEGGSVLRVFMDALRSVVVWAIELLIVAVAGGADAPAARFGERFSLPGSVVELAGFALICAGLVVYVKGERQRGGPQSAVVRRSVQDE